MRIRLSDGSWLVFLISVPGTQDPDFSPPVLRQDARRRSAGLPEPGRTG